MINRRANDIKRALRGSQPTLEEVFVTRPPGFETKGKEEIVYKLYKGLNGLNGELNNIQAFKHEMQTEFEMTNLGELSYFLGIKFKRTMQGIFMHQRKYTFDVWHRFQMMNYNLVAISVEAGIVLCQGEIDQEVGKTLYRQMICSLRYVCNSKPDITYGVGLVSRFIESPKQSYLGAVKRLWRYLKGTIGYGILYPASSNRSNNMLIGYSDVD
ncbi:PREDICTED: uncharacterized protein LOC109342484 [Lupinus angustifolius]|uniref:uncharacterized protein LOC109342484 n=1 Tax=Lupinus angustifolius TaxID=3871 RepID=UPI00092EAECB|nr:PREDICTED: uncharacterized protein LOC109342484 [Lupinus angustifolius]